jgi:outer membrane receptor protein involved in Fe transport
MLFAALAVALPASLAAQTGRVTGRVLNASNNSPIGVAQITIGDTGLGVAATQDGRFVVLNVPVGTHEVVAERIGFRTERQMVQVSATEVAFVEFRMSETALELDELVVTGTPGASSRRELGNSVGSVRAAALENTPSQTLTEILNGQTTGLQQWRNEGQVGGGSKIVLRGINSISQDVQPLIYIDGIRMNNNSGIYNNRSSINPGPAGAQTSPNPLDLIDPSDIERVEVVRGSAATTLYGTEAAGGVIQIFTKQGRAGQRATWTAEMTGGTRFMTGNTMGPVLGKTDDWGFTKKWYSRGELGEAKLSVSGGTNTVRYFVSAGMNYEDGVIDNNDDRSYSIRGNFGLQPAASLNVNLNTSYTHRSTNYMEMGDNGSGFMLNVLRGTKDYTNAAVDRDNYQGDPDQILFDITNSGRVEHFVGGLTTTHTADGLGLTTRVTLGLDYTTAFNQQNFPFDHVLQPRGLRNLNEWEHRTITFDAGTSWQTDLTESLSSNFSAGGQIFSDWDHTVYGVSEDFGGPGEKTLTSGATTTSSEDLLKVVNAGFFAQEVLGISDKLFLTGGLRVDGNSAFGEDLGLQFYPKFSTAYVISDSDFWPSDWWPVMKLRAAWGQSGKAPGAFDAVRTWNPVAGYEGQAGVTPANLGNPDLGPERSTELELGFEGSLLDDRLGLDVSWYNSVTSDALMPVTAAPSEGFLSSQLRNVGEFKNTGIEVSVTGVPVALENVRWEVTGRVSTVNSEVIDLGGAPEFFLGWGSILGQWVRVGYPIVSLWGESVSNPDAIADPVIEEDHYYGPIYPTHILSANTSINLFKRLTIYALGEFHGGQHQFNIMPWQQVRRGLWPECNELGLQNADDAAALAAAPAIWRARCQLPTPNFDFWMRPSDFFKLRTVSASLLIPDNLIPGARGTTLTATVQNPFKWTRGAGIDPELTVGYYGGVGTFPARYEYYQLPAPVMFSVSLRANF